MHVDRKVIVVFLHCCNCAIDMQNLIHEFSIFARFFQKNTLLVSLWWRDGGMEWWRDGGMEGGMLYVCGITQQRKHLESSGFHWKIAYDHKMKTSYFWIHENLIKLTKFSKWRTKVQNENYLNQVLLENYREFHKTLFPENIDLVEALPDMCHLPQKKLIILTKNPKWRPV